MFTSTGDGRCTSRVRATRGRTWIQAVGETGRNTSTFGRAKPIPKYNRLPSVRSIVTHRRVTDYKRMLCVRGDDSPLAVQHALVREGHHRFHCLNVIALG